MPSIDLLSLWKMKAPVPSRRVKLELHLINESDAPTPRLSLGHSEITTIVEFPILMRSYLASNLLSQAYIYVRLFTSPSIMARDIVSALFYHHYSTIKRLTMSLWRLNIGEYPKLEGIVVVVFASLVDA